MRMEGGWRLLLAGASMFMVAQVSVAQEMASAVAPPPAVQSTASPTTVSATASADTRQAEKAKAAQAKKQEKAKAEEEKRVRKAEKARKKIYTGPNTVIVLPATPMLDDEGRQRLDPDGKPMFNPPVQQQRDKKGHPLFDANGKPVFQTATDRGYDIHGKKIRVHKVKPPKMIPLTISSGTFTVDGMIGKADLNYDIANFQYMYLYAPGIGTLVVSNHPFQGAKEEKGAFSTRTLTVTAENHKLQVASDTPLLRKSRKAESAYVLVDRDFLLPSPYPVVGYGGVLKAPYVWPGSRKNAPLKGEFVTPPPIPVPLQPVYLLSPCPNGEMRKPAPPVLPGQKSLEQPCVPIPKGMVTMSGATAPAAPVPAPQ